jgi:hypothetical protein
VKVTKTGKTKKAPHRSEMLLFSHVTTKFLLQTQNQLRASDRLQPGR